MVMQWLAKNDIEIFNPETKIIDKKLLYDVIEKLFESKDLENILGKNLRSQSNYGGTYNNWPLIKNELIIKISSEINETAILSVIMEIEALIGLVPVYAFFNNEIRIDMRTITDKTTARNTIENVFIRHGFSIEKDIERSIWKIR